MHKTFAILFLLAHTSLSGAVQLPDFPFVFANGQAQEKVAPDIATVSFDLTAFDTESTNALSIVEKVSVEVLALIEQLNIKREDVVAFQIEKRAERERKDYTQLGILGYTVSRRIAVTIRDLTQYDTIVKSFMARSNLVEIYSNFDRTDRDKIESDLTAKASTDALRQARSLAQGFGVELGPVFAISQKGFEDFAEEFGIGEDSRGGVFGAETESPEIYFIPSTITLYASVSAIYRLGKTE